MWPEWHKMCHIWYPWTQCFPKIYSKCHILCTEYFTDVRCDLIGITYRCLHSQQTSQQIVSEWVTKQKNNKTLAKLIPSEHSHNLLSNNQRGLLEQILLLLGSFPFISWYNIYIKYRIYIIFTYQDLKSCELTASSRGAVSLNIQNIQ